MTCRKDAEIAGVNSKLESEQALVAQLQKKIKELQVSILTAPFYRRVSRGAVASVCYQGHLMYKADIFGCRKAVLKMVGILRQSDI